MGRSLVLLLALTFGLVGCSQEPSAMIVSHGIYDAQIFTKSDLPRKISVEVDYIDKVQLKETTTRIPCRAGVNFGIEVEIYNPSPFSQVHAVAIMTHPPITSPDGTTLTEDETDLGVFDFGRQQVPYLWCFLKEQPYEYVPGTWSLRIEIDGRESAKCDFEIYQP